MYKYLGNNPFDFDIKYDDFKQLRKNVITEYTGKGDYWSDTAHEAGFDENTNVWKSFQEDFPQYLHDYIETFDITPVTSNFHIQKPGYIIPPHKDNFLSVKDEDKKTRQTCRIFVFMSDWQFGQILMVEDKVLHNWKKGDTWIWDSDALHMSANGSVQDKLSLIITGFVN